MRRLERALSAILFVLLMLLGMLGIVAMAAAEERERERKRWEPTQEQKASIMEAAEERRLEQLAFVPYRVEEKPEEPKAPEGELPRLPIPMGTYRVTAYCACEVCCGEWAKNRPNGIVVGAAGVPLEAGVSCASALPMGTEIEIDGLGTYVVQDRMADWVIQKYGENCVDLYFTDHQEALEFGVQQREVSIHVDH